MKDFKEELAKYGYNLNNSVPVPTLIEQILPEIFKKSLEEAFKAGVKRGHSGYPDTDNWTQPKFEEWFNKFKK